MAQTVTPAWEQAAAAIKAAIAEDAMMIGQAAQLGNTEAALMIRSQLDYGIAGLINAMWTSEATVDAFGLTVKGWLVTDQHLSPNDAAGRVAAARELLVRDEVAGALRDGKISHDHAKTITSTVRKFPAEDQDFVEKELVEASRHCDPSALGRACRELRERLDLDHDADARRERLYGQRYLRTSPTIDGMTKLDAMLDPVTAAALKEALTPLRKRRGDEDDRTQAQRDHDALGEALGLTLRSGDLPDNGGQPPQIVVTLQLADLIDGLNKVHVPTDGIDGQPLPPAQLRTLACDAGIIPTVMNGASEVLDLGRATRTWSKAQRLAARLRDGDTCTWPGGCTIPTRYCQLHHIEFWSQAGTTDHRNSAHLCGFHHWLVHNKNWNLWRNNKNWNLWRNNNGTLQCQRT